MRGLGRSCPALTWRPLCPGSVCLSCWQNKVPQAGAETQLCMCGLLRGRQSEARGSSLIRVVHTEALGVDLSMPLPGLGAGGDPLSCPWLVDTLPRLCSELTRSMRPPTRVCLYPDVPFQ